MTPITLVEKLRAWADDMEEMTRQHGNMLWTEAKIEMLREAATELDVLAAYRSQSFRQELEAT